MLPGGKCYRLSLILFGVAVWPLQVLVLGSGEPHTYREGETVDEDDQEKPTDVQYRAGQTCLRKGDLQCATDHFRELLQADPSHIDGHVNLGDVLMRRNDAVGAAASYRAALKLDPKRAGTLFLLADVLRNKGDLEEADKVYRATLRINPQYAASWKGAAVDLSTLSSKDGENDSERGGPEKGYGHAIGLGPQDIEAHLDLGAVLISSGEWKAAEDSYRAVLEIDPLHVFAHFKLGNVLGRTSDKKGAESAFRKILQIDPQHVGAQFALESMTGTTSKEARNIEEYFNDALRQDPRDAIAHNYLGLFFRDNDNLQGAEENYRAALSLDAEYVEAHVGLARVLERRGDPRGTRKSYLAALRFDPNRDDLREEFETSTENFKRLFRRDSKLGA